MYIGYYWLTMEAITTQSSRLISSHQDILTVKHLAFIFRSRGPLLSRTQDADLLFVLEKDRP